MYYPVVIASPAFTFKKWESSASLQLLCRQHFFNQSSLSISRETKCGQSFEQILVCEIFFFSKCLEIYCRIVSQCLFKEFKTRSFCGEEKIFETFRLNSELSLLLCLSWLNVLKKDIKRNCTGKVRTLFERKKYWKFWKFFIPKHELFFCNLLVPWWVGHFWNCKPHCPFTLRFSGTKIVKRLYVMSRISFQKHHKLNQLKRIHCLLTLINCFW